MEPLKITIPLLARPKKNSQQMIFNKRTGKPMIIQSKQYLSFERDCAYFLKRFARHIATPINLKCLFYVPERRRRDLCNLLEGMQDILVKYGVIEDDNYNVVAGVDGSRVIYEKRKRRNSNRDRGDKRMNYLMEKIENKFKETTDTLVLHYYADVFGAAIFFLGALLFINAAANESKIVFMVLYILATAASVVVTCAFIKGFEEYLKGRLRDCRNTVDVAMHKDKGNHISRID